MSAHDVDENLPDDAVTAVGSEPSQAMAHGHGWSHEDARVAASTVPVAKKGTKGGWPQPDLSLLDDRRAERPAFPDDVLPPFWQAWARHVACGASAPIDYVALSLLTATSSLLGGIRHIAPLPSWREPFVLWTAMAGSPSSGRTPAMEAVLRLVRTLQDELAVISAVRRPLVVDDVTLAAMAGDTVPDTPHGVLLARDGRSFALSQPARATEDGRERAFWLAVWSASERSLSHNEEAVAGAAAPAISILCTLPSNDAAAAFADDGDGMGSRFLFVSPGRGFFEDLPDTAMAVDGAAVAALARIRDLSATSHDVPLAPDARALFNHFRQRHHADAGRLNGRSADWWGKGTGTVLRLAGVLTYLDWAARMADAAEPAAVPEWAINAAAHLWGDYLWLHARAVLRSGAHDTARASRVLRWLRTHRVEIVSRTTLRRNALGRTCDAAETESIAQTLVSCGWLAPIQTVTERPGRPPVLWAVNPALHTTRDE